MTTGGLRRDNRALTPAVGLPAAPPVQSAKSRTRRTGGGWPVWAGAVAVVLGITVITAAAFVPNTDGDTPIQLVAAAAQPADDAKPAIPCPAFAGGEASNTRSTACGRPTSSDPDAVDTAPASEASDPDAPATAAPPTGEIVRAAPTRSLGGRETGATDPEDSVPGASEPGTSNSGTSEEEPSAPVTSTPGKTNPGTSLPGKNNPGTSNPGTSTPGTSTPAPTPTKSPTTTTPPVTTPTKPPVTTPTTPPVTTPTTPPVTTPTTPPVTTPTTPPVTTPTTPPVTTPTTPPTTTPTTPPTTTPTTPPTTTPVAQPEPLAFTGKTESYVIGILGIRLLSSTTVSISGEPGATATVTAGLTKAGTVTFDANGNASITFGKLLSGSSTKISVAYSDGTAGDSITAKLGSI